VMQILWLCSYIVLCLVLTSVRDTAQAATPEQIFARAAPSVVVVEMVDEKGVPAAQGSGVVTGPGLVITPCHVVQAGQRLRVWHGETPFAATLGYADPEHDLCQVYTPKLQAPPAVRGTVKNLAVGQPAYIISAPQGLSLTFTAGIISALRPVLGSVLIQTDAAVSPGSSGGGLFDRAGRLIGMPCFQLQEGQHLNFALPVDWIMHVAQRPIKHRETVPSPGAALPDWVQHSTALRTPKSLLVPIKPGSND
jgi:serine protease Do